MNQNTSLPKTDIDLAQLFKLEQLTTSLGASNARIINSRSIPVEDRLADLCLKPRCQNYGKSMSCPPYVSGPQGFRKMQQRFRYALVVQIIVPSLMIYSSESRELGRYLYELVATIEQEAVKMGYSHSIAFAGGSCKQLFCYNHPACQKIATGECRYPQIARTSMSGYGINVFEMIGNCGWEVNLNSDGVESETEAMSWIAGLVLVG